MPRPKPVVPLVLFNVRLPKSYTEALPQLVTAWHADVTAKLAAQGFHTGPPADRTALVKAMLDEFFGRYGVEVDRGLPPAKVTAAPAATRAKTKAKRTK